METAQRLSRRRASTARTRRARSWTRARWTSSTSGGVTVGSGVVEPGWRWSEHARPIAGTDSCQAAHTGYILSGRMHVVMDDGTDGHAGPGDAFVIPPGHDAWTVGDDPCVFLDFSGMADYIKH
jgi:quercetin dioxygenase-like cupin family protein